jgi:L-fucose mutarotase
MLKASLLHPDILAGLSRSGHGSRILISDANYPVATKVPPRAQIVFLNLSPGLVTVTQVLRPVLELINVESATTMVPPNGPRPPVHDEIHELFPEGLNITECLRAEFYEQAKTNDTSLVIATGEQRRFANVLLTIGVVSPKA